MQLCKSCLDVGWLKFHLGHVCTAPEVCSPKSPLRELDVSALEDAMQSPAPGQEQADTLPISCPLPPLLGRDAATSPPTTEAENDAPIHPHQPSSCLKRARAQ